MGDGACKLIVCVRACVMRVCVCLCLCLLCIVFIELAAGGLLRSRLE